MHPVLPRPSVRFVRCVAAAILALGATLPLLAACSHEARETPATGGGEAVKAGATIPAAFALAAEPAGAKPIKEVIATAKSGDEVVATGSLGEEVAGLAAFRLVDLSIPSCLDDGMEDCKTPWDYCCTPEEDRPKLMAMVELRDGGHPIAADVLGFAGLEHLKTVVVQGRAEKDSAGNLTVVASGVFVRK